MAESNTSTLNNEAKKMREMEAGKVKNPYLGSVDRGPYLLGHLLRDMPPARSPLNAKTYLMTEAARQHADNGTTTLVNGLGAIGSLMLGAGIAQQDGNSELSARDLTALGELIQHLAVEVQFLREAESSMSDDLRNWNQCLAKEAA
jgi:hypothetical protein